MNQNQKPRIIPNTTITRDLRLIDEKTDNIYESIVIMSKRANQIAVDTKEELTSTSDNLEEIFENREQIEISRHYERLPKPTALAIDEFLEDKIYYRNPKKDN